MYVADSKIMVIDTYLAYGSYFYNHSLFLKLNIIIYILITRLSHSNVVFDKDLYTSKTNNYTTFPRSLGILLYIMAYPILPNRHCSP